jgi:hypothetical protein
LLREAADALRAEIRQRLDASAEHLAGLERDAARYRWLRDVGYRYEVFTTPSKSPSLGPYILLQVGGEAHQTSMLSGSIADGVIDAAIAGAGRG